MQTTQFNIKKRLLVLLISAVLLFIGIFSRFFYIQIVWGEHLQKKAFDQWTRDLPIVALRGQIVDRLGTVLVNNNTRYTVYVRNKDIVDSNNVADILSEYLNLDRQTVYEKVCKRGVSDVTIKRQVLPEIANLIRSYALKGVYFATEGYRNYPFGDLLTQVLGFVSSDNMGQTGLEKQYDKFLTGINGYLLTQSDLVGRQLEGEETLYMPATNGYTLVLTIDAIIQMAVEEILDQVMFTHNPKSAKCVVLDVTTGDILAMSCKPSYNMNEIPRDDVSLLMEYSRNTLLTDIYEPGSTFKVLTAAASLEEARLGNANAFDCSHIFSNNSDVRYLDSTRIKCWTKHTNGKHSNQTLSLALNNSCNPIFTDIALSLGAETMYKYLESFGYGQISGIDYPGEQAGLLVDRANVTVNDLARIGFGQTIAVTPLQLCMATAAAINGGYLLTPRLVSQIIDQETGKIVKTFPVTVRNRPISQQTSAEIAKMLQDVVTVGSGKHAYIEGYNVGGKTGTAQKYENGVIAAGKYVSSFVGAFPCNNPKYLVLMIVDEPEGQSYGSIVAAPYAKMVFELLVNYYHIPPQE